LFANISFYLWTSFVGVLGGVFNTLVPPLLFAGIFEYSRDYCRSLG
jgi:hypothetical protein